MSISLVLLLFCILKATEMKVVVKNDSADKAVYAVSGVFYITQNKKLSFHFNYLQWMHGRWLPKSHQIYILDDCVDSSLNQCVIVFVQSVQIYLTEWRHNYHISRVYLISSTNWSYHVGNMSHIHWHGFCHGYAIDSSWSLSIWSKLLAVHTSWKIHKVDNKQTSMKTMLGTWNLNCCSLIRWSNRCHIDM